MVSSGDDGSQSNGQPASIQQAGQQHTDTVRSVRWYACSQRIVTIHEQTAIRPLFTNE